MIVCLPERKRLMAHSSATRQMILRFVAFLIAVSAMGAPVHAQSEPYTVYDTRPVITEGPYLIASSETTATVVWLTDTPSHAKVLYGPDGDLSATAEPQVDGPRRSGPGTSCTSAACLPVPRTATRLWRRGS